MKRLFLLLPACLGLFFTGLLEGATKPNIIVIYTDDQGYGDASCLNPEAKFKTPNLDRLAAEGIAFTNGHCAEQRPGEIMEGEDRGVRSRQQRTVSWWQARHPRGRAPGAVLHPLAGRDQATRPDF